MPVPVQSPAQPRKPESAAETYTDAKGEVWSVDRRGLPLHLDVRAVRPTSVSEDELARGVRLKPIEGLGLAVAEVKAGRPGVLRLAGEATGVRWSAVPGEPLEPVATGALSMLTGRGLLAVDASGPVTVKGARVRLTAGGEAVQLPLDRQPLLVDLEPGDGPLVAFATSMVGQPAVRVVDAGDRAELHLDATAVAPQAAVSVALGGRQPALVAWLADGGDAAEAQLRQVSLRVAAPGRAALGLNEGELAAGQARALELPAGISVLDLAATPGVVAAIALGGEVLSVHWGGMQPLCETVTADGGTVWLLATGDAAARYTVELRKAEAASPVVTAEQPFIAAPTRSGMLRLGIQPGRTDLTLRVLGASAPATLLGADSRVRRGSSFASGDGTLLVHHDAAPVMVWLEPEGDAASALWQGVKESTAEAVDLPFACPLGKTVQALKVEVAAPTLLTVRRSAGAVLRLVTGSISRSWVSVAGGVDHLPLEQGSSTLSVRPLASGEVELVGSPITDVGEGLGPEVLLPPGGGHVFRFRVTTAGPVGVGVRAEADTVDCELLADGKSLGSGVVQMHDLQPGEYLLVLRLAAGGQPVRARPAVVGIETPSTGPPEEVIRQYLDMERSQL